MVLNNQTRKVPGVAPTPLKQAAISLSLVLLGAGVTFSLNYFVAGHRLNLATFPPSGDPHALMGTRSAITVSGNPLLNFITVIVAKVGPAVVRIDSSRTVTHQLPEALNNPLLGQFLESDFPIAPLEPVQQGEGSGFIINSNGQILTNAHVVEGSKTVKVTLKDGRHFVGKVIGTDPLSDVAVVKIQASHLPTVTFANSDALKPGLWAIAIGNPMGLNNTITVGVISGTSRSSSQVGLLDKRVEFIQTDAAINPGNSGGPLLNASGQVIGMNTAIIQGAQFLGLAIPSNMAQRIAKQLVTQGQVERAYLGIQMVTLTPELEQNINSNPHEGLSVNDEIGVLILKVMPHSPAAQAGLRAGDVIHKINGQLVKNQEAVQNVIENAQVDNNLQLELRRHQQQIKVTVQLAPFPTQN